MTSYDWYAFSCSVLLAVGAYLVLGARPRRFYKAVRNEIKRLLSYRLITKAERDDLYRQIDALHEQIRLLHTAPIKQEKGGQLGFGDMFDSEVSHEPIWKGPLWNDKKQEWMYQVWRPSDYQRWKNNETLVKRTISNNGKQKVRRMWVTEVLKNDEVVDPFEWRN